MMIKNPFVQGVALIVVATVAAIVANGFAAPQRRLVLPGFYPNALQVPPRQPDPAPAPAAVQPAAGATTTVQSPGPGQPPMELTTSAVPTTTAAHTTTAQVAAPPAGTAAPSTPTNAAAPVPAPGAAAPAEDPLTRFRPHPDKPFVEISGEDAALLYARGMLFLDARRTSVFEEGHIAGARPFSVWESDVDKKVEGLFNERSDPREQDKPIVIYCSGGACEDSHMLAQKLWGVQFNNVYVYRDGYPDWIRRGGATRTGAQP